MLKIFYLRCVALILVTLASISSSAEPESISSQVDTGIVSMITGKLAATSNYNDGPYVFIEQSKLVEKTIIAGKVITKEQPLESQLTNFEIDSSSFSGVSNIAAISDIHGQHDVFMTILKRHNIIDEQSNWSFDNGHFVITGDIFDRGPQVLETLWFVFNLQQQAEKQGGKVHFLLGNHEYMVLHGRLGYLHDKYKTTSDLLAMEYQTLFNANTVLGRWLRSKSTVIKINSTLYLHGGLSEGFLAHKLNLDIINQRYRESIELSASEIADNSMYSMLHDRESPIWYRGYIMEDGLTNTDVDKILQQFDATRVVVGHTSLSKIKKLNNGKIYAVDSSIKKGIKGEILLLSDEQVLRGRYDGTTERLH